MKLSNYAKAQYKGRELAFRDIARLRRRAYRATDKQLSSRCWLTTQYAYAMWLGFTAPPLWTAVGKAYNRTMSDATTPISSDSDDWGD